MSDLCFFLLKLLIISFYNWYAVKNNERGIFVITDTKTVVNLLLIMLFLTMVILSPNIMDFSYFLVLFMFLYISGFWDT